MRRIFLLLIVALVATASESRSQAVASLSYTPWPTWNDVLLYAFTNNSTYWTGTSPASIYTKLYYGDGDSTGGYGTRALATHSYPDTGSYVYTLVVQSLDNNSNIIEQDSLVDTIHVRYQHCSFIARDSLVNDSTVRFWIQNLAGGQWGAPMPTWWSFGDFTSDSGNSVIHTYATSGNYQIAVSSYNGPTCWYQSFYRKNFQRTSLVDCDSLRPVMTLTSSGVKVSAGISLAKSYPRTAVQLNFSYGDGTPVTAVDTHAYQAPGRYRIHAYLDVYDSTTLSVVCRDTLIDSVHLVLPTIVDCDSLGATLATRTLGSDVWMTLQTAKSYPQTRLDVLYDYGDGSAVTTVDSHFYFTSGRFAVRSYVAVYDTAALSVVCRDTLQDSIHVQYVTSFINGLVYYDSLFATGFTGEVAVSLIRYDPVMGSYAPVDSMILGVPGPLEFYFRHVAPGQYLLKAATAHNAYAFAGILPTYSFSTLLWNQANIYSFNGLQAMGATAVIVAKAGAPDSGPGIIGGRVSKTGAGGNPAYVAGVSMILLGSGGGIVAMTETDDQGYYAFSSLTEGSYTVQPERLSFTSSSSTSVSITSSVTTISDVNFIVDDAGRRITPGSLGVRTPAGPGLRISPNPARNSVRIVADGKAALELELRDLSGKVVHRASMAAGSVLNLDVRSYTPGLYFLHTGSGAPVKLVIE